MQRVVNHELKRVASKLQRGPENTQVRYLRVNSAIAFVMPTMLKNLALITGIIDRAPETMVCLSLFGIQIVRSPIKVRVEFQGSVLDPVMHHRFIKLAAKV